MNSIPQEGIHPQDHGAVAALRYHDRGWRVIPIPLGEKRPTTPKWTKLELTRGQARRPSLVRTIRASCSGNPPVV